MAYKEMPVPRLASVIAWSVANCHSRATGRCAGYVKRAFAAGGCEYVSGDGFMNQRWCLRNGFVLVGEFIPYGGRPRPSGGRPIQFPPGYRQVTGDVCLMTHEGGPGHMAYAAGPGLDDWCSDFWQRPPGQRAGCGPYCYEGGVGRVQMWRHRLMAASVPAPAAEACAGSVLPVLDAMAMADIPEFSPDVPERAEVPADDPRSWVDGGSENTNFTLG